MANFTKISSDLFNNLQRDAGVLLNKFDISGTKEINDEDIICATTGGINPSCVPSFVDDGEDIDNCPENTKELKRIESWECKISTTCLDMTEETIRLSLGVADATGGKIIPRDELKTEDFRDVWWVGDVGKGDFAAVKLINALSTGGFSLKTEKKNKGQIELELTGHVSIENTSIIPMEFYRGTVTSA
ncbi:MAG: hypothetical protein Q4D45_12995 [Lachnospiraceae bacterium]|nr:hypothetical protein [Lachnospiraceae bacterium]